MSDRVSTSGVSNGNIPKSSRVASFNVTLVSGAAVSFDLRPFVYKNMIKQVQGIFVDNSANSTFTSVQTAVNQTVIVPPNSQGFFPLYLSDDDTLQLVGNGTVNYVLLNFPTPAAVWSVSAPATFPTQGGKVLVTDATLDALVANGVFQSSLGLYGNADAINHARGGNAYSGVLNTAATTTIITGAPSAFVSAFDLALSPDATQTTAGIVTVSGGFSSAGQTFSRKVYVPATAANGAPTPIISMKDLALIGNLASDSFTLTLSAALATGGVEYTVIGGTTAVL